MDNFLKIPNSFQKLADITLKTEDGYSFKFYKILLAQTSKYFETLFTSNFNQNVHTLAPEIKGKTLHQILSYIAQKEDILTEDNASDVVFIADYFKMEDLINKCRTFIFEEGCTIGNCIQIYNTACVCGLKDIKAICLRFIVIHTLDVFTTSTTDIIDLSYDAFKGIIECKNLNTHESSVWAIIISWIKGNTPNRQHHLPELVQYVRFQEIDDEILTQLNELLPVEKIHFFCHNLERSNMNYLEQIKKCPVSDDLPDSRLPSKIYFICKQIPQRAAELYITYDERFDYWHLLGKLPKHYSIRCSHICFSGQFVYFSFYIFPTEIKAFDLLDESWTPVSDVTPSVLTSYKVVSVNGDIYALGGMASSVWEVADDDVHNLTSDMPLDWNSNLDETSEEEDSNDDEMSDEEENEENADVEEEEDLYEPVIVVDIVQRYNRETDSWQLMSPMTAVRIIEAVVLNNKIYVIGVSENNEACQDMICQMYDPTTNAWTLIPNPEFYRTSCAVATYNGKLYLIGGSDRSSDTIKKVEEYNPTESAWRTLSDLPSEYYNPEAIIIKNKLIVFDKGKWNAWKESRLDENQCSIFWDSENDIWCEATFINKELLLELRLCRIYPIQNMHVCKEVISKHKRGRCIWTKSTLIDLDMVEMTTSI